MTQDEMDIRDEPDDDDLIHVQRSRQKALQQKYVESGVTVGELEKLYQMCAGIQSHIRDQISSGRHFALTDKEKFIEVTNEITAIWTFVYGEKP